jgi:hypothetical protein
MEKIFAKRRERLGSAGAIRRCSLTPPSSLQHPEDVNSPLPLRKKSPHLRQHIHTCSHWANFYISRIAIPRPIEKEFLPGKLQNKMTTPPPKRQKRDEYRKATAEASDVADIKLPKKKYYRQRAHANPFSDHALK